LEESGELKKSQPDVGLEEQTSTSTSSSSTSIGGTPSIKRVLSYAAAARQGKIEDQKRRAISSIARAEEARMEAEVQHNIYVNRLVSEGYYKYGVSDRRLVDRSAITMFVRDNAPGKLRLDVLKGVFSAFWGEFEKKRVDLTFSWLHTIQLQLHSGAKEYDGTEHRKAPVFFEFEQMTWRATVYHEIANDNGTWVYHIYVHLPNDGYVYSSEFQRNDKEEMDTRIEEAEQLFLYVFDKVDNLLAPTKFGEVVYAKPYYRDEKERTQIFFRSTNNLYHLKIGWEYGHHEGDARGTGAVTEIAQHTQEMITRFKSAKSKKNPI